MRFLSLPDIFNLPESILRRLVALPIQLVEMMLGQGLLVNTPPTPSLFGTNWGAGGHSHTIPSPRYTSEANARGVRRRRLRLEYRRRHAGEYFEPSGPLYPRYPLR